MFYAKGQIPTFNTIVEDSEKKAMGDDTYDIAIDRRHRRNMVNGGNGQSLTKHER